MLQTILSELIKDLQGARGTIKDNEDLMSRLSKIGKKYKQIAGKLELGRLYRKLQKENPAEFPYIEELNNLLIKKAIRSDSGIINVSVSLPPDKFSCKYNCYFCPNEPGMPRSYLSNEDVFKRAADVEFNTVQQVYSRLKVLEKNGHPIDKLEFRVLGGTFSCYDHAIADNYIRDLYYAANTYFDGPNRTPGTIEEEQHINTTAKAHVVGLGVETRPDEINEAEIIRFRRYGVTRVELGVQHTNDALLKKVNRGHGLLESKNAIKLLKDYGFKVEIHIMTDLPGATPEMDKDCYRLVLKDDPDLIPDYMKDYPCLDVSYTIIKDWKKTGKWRPYSEEDAVASKLQDVLVFRQSITPKYVRVNRIQRDFKPATCQVKDIEDMGVKITKHQLGYDSASIKSNLAQIVKDAAEAQGIYCQCIRCCEIRGEDFDPADIQYKIVKFMASGGVEYFISAEINRPNRHLLLGFLRLRISHALHESIIGELRGPTAMIRELHVYGRVREVGRENNSGTAQHLGIGKRLLAEAEALAKQEAMTRVAVISGIGVRDYYRKQGYVLKGTYMIKELPETFMGMVVFQLILFWQFIYKLYHVLF